MKKICVFVFIAISCFQYLHADDFCKILNPSQFNYSVQQLNSQRLQAYNLEEVNSRSYTIRVFFHIIRRSDGTGGYPASVIPQCLSILNEDFNPFNIRFSLMGSDEILSNLFYDYSSTNSDDLFLRNRHSNALDIYLGPADSNFEGGVANGIPAKSCLVSGTSTYCGNENVNLVLSHVLSHEVGHCLGLFHTFHGTEIYLEGGAGTCPELVNGSNGETCGDYVLDTPADPVALRSHYSEFVDCNWITGLVDANGDLYDPDEEQIMSYSCAHCMSHFSCGQGERMKYFLATNSVLQQCLIPEVVNIENAWINTGGSIFEEAEEINVVGTTIENEAQATLITHGKMTLQPQTILAPGGTGKISLLSVYHAPPGDCYTAATLATAVAAKSSASLLKAEASTEGYHPFLNNSKWFTSEVDGGYFVNKYYYMAGDTIINGNLYYSIMCKPVLLPGVPNSPYFVDMEGVDSYLRENIEEKKVYKWNNVANRDEVLFDFNLKVGDRLNTNPNAVLAQIDTIETVDGPRKKFDVSELNASNVSYIEGVGYVAGFNTSQTSSSDSRLICSYQDDKLVYDYGDFQGISCSGFVSFLASVKNTEIGTCTLYPNPVNNNFYIYLHNGTIKSVRIIGLNGRLVKDVGDNIDTNFINNIDISSLAPGIYLCVVTTMNGEVGNFKLLKE